jgi:ATP-dependent HslUV protease subunit HslV
MNRHRAEHFYRFRIVSSKVKAARCQLKPHCKADTRTICHKHFMFRQLDPECQFEHLKLKLYHLVFMQEVRKPARIRSTTVLMVQREGKIAMAGDGQVTLGETVIKGSARKVRRLAGGKILAGFAGSTADAFSLLQRFETKLEQFQTQLERAAIELSKDWRTDKYLRNLEALLIVADSKDAFLISGKGDVISSDDGLLSVGSGSMYALAAARALMTHTSLSAPEIAREALRIASEICIYTNSDIIVEEL